MSFRQSSLSTSMPRKSRASLLTLCAALLMLALALWGGMEYRYRQALANPHDGPAELKLFTIPEGANLTEISAGLEREGFVSSASTFTKYVDRQKAATQIQSGRFYLAQNLTIPDLAGKILNDAKREILFTIPEGLTLSEIDARIAEYGYAPTGTFLDCIEKSCDFSEFSFLPADRTLWEGYFFPETYAIHPGSFSPADLGAKMLSEFKKRADDLGILEHDDLDELVIMASLIEKESRKDAERPVISGILWKRLRENWLLDVDATVRYFTKKTTEPLTRADLDIESPYNTRKVHGLPPGAICNPSASALKAAAEPEDSPYYYYLHGSDGNIYFATTNTEHNLNRERYL